MKTYAESNTVKVVDGHTGMVDLVVTRSTSRLLAVLSREDAKVVVRGLMRFLRETDPRPTPRDEVDITPEPVVAENKSEPEPPSYSEHLQGTCVEAVIRGAIGKYVVEQMGQAFSHGVGRGRADERLDARKLEGK